MPATFGRGSPKVLAEWDQQLLCWKTCKDIFGLDSTWSSPILPQWGELCGGVLSELPTPGHLTGVRDCSSSPLIPTPTVSDVKGPSPNHHGTTAETIRDLTLLPSPTASDYKGSRRATARKDHWTSWPGVTLTDAAWLLPTPTRSLGTKGASVASRYPDPKRSNDLDDAVAWAIEQIGRSSPQPSNDGNGSWEEVPLPLWSTEPNG